MIVKINGEYIHLEREITLAELVKFLELENKMFALELNMQIIPKDSYNRTILKENDSIEIASLCAGG